MMEEVQRAVRAHRRVADPAPGSWASETCLVAKNYQGQVSSGRGVNCFRQGNSRWPRLEAGEDWATEILEARQAKK